jgi:hypothetical protein
MKKKNLLEQLAVSHQEIDHQRRKEKAEPLSHEGIRHFFEECHFDPYSKDDLGPNSYRVVGEPVHGGYAYDQKGEESASDRDPDQ